METMKLEIKLMPEEMLKDFERGRWRKAFIVSIDNFKTFYKTSPDMRMGVIVDKIKLDNGDL